MYNEIPAIRSYFVNELKNENFTIDKTGQKTIELIGASFIADEPAIFGTPDEQYIKDEIDWYKSMSTNIHDIWGPDKEPPKAWQYAANKHGEINSNYGKLIFSLEYCNQFDNVISELLKNPDSRRACMVYNRPSIWYEYNADEKSDFICTNAVTYYIRDNKLHAVVQMRSNDVVFGYKNDYAWAKHVLEEVLFELQSFYGMCEYTAGDIYWQVQNLHVYEKHFHLVK